MYKFFFINVTWLKIQVRKNLNILWKTIICEPSSLLYLLFSHALLCTDYNCNIVTFICIWRSPFLFVFFCECTVIVNLRDEIFILLFDDQLKKIISHIIHETILIVFRLFLKFVLNLLTIFSV